LAGLLLMTVIIGLRHNDFLNNILLFRISLNSQSVDQELMFEVLYSDTTPAPLYHNPPNHRYYQKMESLNQVDILK